MFGSPFRILPKLAILLVLPLLVAMLGAPVRGADSAGSPSFVKEVLIIADIPYSEGPDANPIKHKLDIYLPRKGKDFPVLFFVHGGGWRHGDKNFLGMYRDLGIFWARHGVATVVINYRLSPFVTHPGHIQDVAKAFAWTYRNIARYGGRADHIFLAGHSAGGHLVALLATDPGYLKAEGLNLATIKGVMPLSGVFDLEEDNAILEEAFGTDLHARRNASPLTHVGPGVPPFLIIFADHDLSLCGKECADKFCEALRAQHADARTVEIKGRNHVTVLLFSRSEGDPAAEAMLHFMTQHK